MPQITMPAAAAPMSSHAQPGNPPDSEPSSLEAAAAPAAAAAAAWLVDDVVVGVVDAVTVWVCVAVVDDVGPVTVSVRVAVVADSVFVTVVVRGGDVVGVEVDVVAAAAVFACSVVVAGVEADSDCDRVV
jgi:ABC-type amino acid transport substrate-binding protein